MDALSKVCTRCGTRFDASAAFCPRDGTPLAGETEAPDPYIGQTLLGQFRIEEKVGAGGMGTVYRARQIGVDRHVAIKILHPELVQDADAVRRFQREARVSAALDHPNVVRVILFGQLPDGSLYLIMEYLEGRSLSDLLRLEGVLAPARALHITTQICDAIGEAHQQGVVHRDVKPENVHLVTRGRDLDFVKVLDFGIARFLWGEQTMVTQSGLIFGTARYISPEGAAGETTDARSDVYSIGVLCYQLLCGETPFDSPSPVALLMKHIHEPAPELRARARGGQVPPPVADVVARALAKNPDARFDDALSFAEALRQAAGAAGIPLGGSRRATAASLAPPAPQPAPAYATVRAPAGPTARAVAASETLAGAPNPFEYDDPLADSPGASGYPNSSIGGLSRRPPRALVFVGAFLLGAVAVGGGAYLARSFSASQGADGRAPAPPIVAPPPAPIVAPPAPPPVAVAGVRTLPAVPRVGETVTLVAVLEASTVLEPGASPHFHVTRAGRALRGEVPATRGTDGGYVGAFTFPQPGEYSVFFVVERGEQRVQLRAEIVVTADETPRVANRDRPPAPGDSPMILTHQQLEPVAPIVVVPPTNPDNIDWAIPPTHPPPPATEPTPPPESGGQTVTDPTPPTPPPVDEPPPAPWTGQPI